MFGPGGGAALGKLCQKTPSSACGAPEEKKRGRAFRIQQIKKKTKKKGGGFGFPWKGGGASVSGGAPARAFKKKIGEKKGSAGQGFFFPLGGRKKTRRTEKKQGPGPVLRPPGCESRGGGGENFGRGSFENIFPWRGEKSYT